MGAGEGPKQITEKPCCLGSRAHRQGIAVGPMEAELERAEEQVGGRGSC